VILIGMVWRLRAGQVDATPNQTNSAEINHGPIGPPGPPLQPPSNYTSPESLPNKPREATDHNQEGSAFPGSLFPRQSHEMATSMFSLQNGTNLRAEQFTSGHGLLTIKNGTESDAVVNVVEQRSEILARSVYVARGSNWTIRRLAPGTYKLIFGTGRGWDDAEGDFSVDANHQEFDKLLVFEETGPQYDHLTLTLNPVFGGNVRTVGIDQARFRALMAQRTGSKLK